MEDQTCFVSGPLAVALRMNRLVGLAPLQFEKKGNGWRVNLSTGFVVYGHLLMTISSLTVLTTIFMALKYQELASQKAWSRRVVWVVEVFMVVITTAAMIHGAPGHMRRVISGLYRLQEINAKLNVYNWPSEWTIKQILLLISWMVLSWLLIGADYAMLITAMTLPEEQMWIKPMYALYFVYYGILELGLMQFMLVVLHIRSTFRIINNSLNQMLLDDGKATKSQQDTVQSMVVAYVAACDVVRDIDDCYGVMLIILLASFFLHLVTTPYYFIMDLLNAGKSILTEPTYVTYITESIQLFWCIFHAVNLMVLIEPCHVSHGEIDGTGDLVSRLMVRARSTYDPLAVELEQFSIQLGLNHVGYRPMNVITLKRGLVLAIFGSIVTYLVVLIDIK